MSFSEAACLNQRNAVSLKEICCFAKTNAIFVFFYVIPFSSFFIELTLFKKE